MSDYRPDREQLSIMLVEDNPGDALLVQESLRGQGANSRIDHIAESLSDALDAFVSIGGFDAILLDLSLPDSSGLATVRKALQGFGDTPIIILTGADDELLATQALALGAQDYLKKGIHKGETVERAIRHAISRARAEKSIDVERDRAQSYLDIANVMFVALDDSGRITLANRKTCSVLGYSEADILGQDWISKFIPKESESALRKILNAFFGEDPSAQEYHENVVLTRSGDSRMIAWHNNLLRDSEGRITGLLSSGEDITERKTAQEEAAKLYLQTQDYATRLSKVLGGTVAAVARIADARDPYTAGHQQRVRHLALAIGATLGLSEFDLEGLGIAATLHDVGKIAVPAEILSKPKSLSDIEMGLIRQHTTMGAEMLEEIDFPWPVQDAVLHHHERLDGSGYPDRLVGQAISSYSRILAVADVVEAMASHRPYRPALGLSAALEEIQDGAGHLYDERIVEACVKVLSDDCFSLDP